MPQSVTKKMEDMDIKENSDEDLIFSDQKGSTLDIFEDDA